jgi:uncharacterized protein
MSNAPAGGFIWYELMTSDAEAASRFYEAVVGWKIPRPAPDAAPDYRMIQRDDGGNAGGVLALSPEMIRQGARPVWLGYLQVTEVDATVLALAADGGRTLMRRSLPVGEIAMVTDPAGAPFYVMKPIPPEGAPGAVSDVFDPKKAQHVRWNELASENLAAAKAFYATHFHFAFNEILPMGPMGDYCFIDHGSQRIGAIMQKPPGSATRGWLFYFGVPSALAAREAILSSGGRIVREPHEVPGGDWVVVAEDPQGAAFAVVGPKGKQEIKEGERHDESDAEGDAVPLVQP